VFFSFVIDVFSRKVVGWQFAAHMRTTLVLDALRMALSTRERVQEVRLIHWSAPRVGVDRLLTEGLPGRDRS
jgi:putative transposase